MVKGNGTDLEDASTAAPVNNWLHSLFCQVDVSMNGTLVTPLMNTYPYRAYIETLLSYGAEAKDTQLQCGQWRKDTTGYMDSVGADNEGLQKRREYILKSRQVELLGRVHADVFMQDRYLLNGVDVKLRLVRSKDAFSLMADGADSGFKVNLLGTSLHVRKAKLNPSVQLGHIKALTKGTAKYPLRRIDCKMFSIPQGTMSHAHENVYLGVLPNRVVLCFIDNDAYNGSYNKNPFNAKHNDINFLALYLDGRQVPSKPLQPNFAEGAYVRSYLDLLASTGKAFENDGNAVMEMPSSVLHTKADG